MWWKKVGKWGLGLCTLGLTWGCTDEAYDLGNLDTEGIRIGDNVSGMLGTKSFTLKELLKDSTKVKADKAGDYYFTSVEQKTLKMADTPKVEDKEYQDIFDKGFGDMWSNTVVAKTGFEESIEDESEPIKLELSDDIKRLDSVILRKGTLQVDFTVSDLTDRNNKTEIKFSVELPEGFVLTDGTTHKDTVFTMKDMSGGKGKVLLPLKRITPGKEDIIRSTFTLSIPKDAGVTSKNGPQFHADAELKGVDYEVIYGQFALGATVEETVIEMDGLKDLFEGDAVLSFADPHIELTATQNIGIPIVADLRLSDGKKPTEIKGVRIEAPKTYTATAGVGMTSRTWIGGNQPANKEFAFVKNTDLAKIISGVPPTLTISGEAMSDSTVASFFRNPAGDPEMEIAVMIPLEPTEDFQVSMSQTIQDVFDADMVDMLFSSGEVELSGDIDNELPLDMELKLDVVDVTGKSVGINWKEQTVAAQSKEEVSFWISERDMPKLKEACDIQLKFTAKGSEKCKGVCLNEGQKISLKLKFKKEGGIVLSDL
jgi:hypothetical protein